MARSRLRDDFPPKVKRELEKRAGHHCSVCAQPTGGPASGSRGAISDGWAAHITAAAPGGPRFNPDLTPDQRRSFENGIWTCTRHGREIDEDKHAYTVELLRGLKWVREAKAKEEMRAPSGPADPSA